MSEATADDDNGSGTGSVNIWNDHRGRTYISDGDDIVHLAHLVAYAEHGTEAFEADHIHHALAADGPDGTGIYVDVPEFVVPLDEDDHRELHDDRDWREVDGIPLLLPDDHNLVDGDEGANVDLDAPVNPDEPTAMTASD